MTRAPALVLAGLASGLLVLGGELLLSQTLLQDDMAQLLARFALPPPTPAIMVQAVLRLLLLGGIAVGLALALQPACRTPALTVLAAGLVLWLVGWVWVQWALLNTGFVTARIATLSVAWGLVELLLATWAGVRLYVRLRCGAHRA